jgi:uncharacterized RDD family membrane protein YckC
MADKKNAGFAIRFVSAIIDAIILSLIGIFWRRGAPIYGRQLFSTLAGALYSILLWVNWNGQTIGKRAMGIKVVKEDGTKLEYQDAIIRYLCYFVSAVPLLLGFFWVIWDSKKQGWHDKIAKTLVIKE